MFDAWVWEAACEKDLKHLVVDPGDALVLFVRGEGDDATPVLEAAAKSIDDILGGARALESTANSRSLRDENRPHQV